MKIRIAVTGGGTGGHVFPAFAVIEKLMGPNIEFVWIGSRTGIEKKLVSERGLAFYNIPSGKLRRYISLKNIFDIFKVGAGVLRSIGLLRKLRVDLLFSKGGFVTVPPVLAARLLKIPVVSHESDYDPGLATKINALSSKYICVPYAASKKYFRPKLQGRVVVTGNPVRDDIFNGDAARGRAFVGAPPGKKILLVQGGSLGAKQINDCVPHWIEALDTDWFIVHQRGRDEWQVKDIDGRYKSYDFISKPYADILKASDFVVSRAGAGSVWEIGVNHKPTAFLPLIEGSRGDQVRNAAYCQSSGASLTLGQSNPGQELVAFLSKASGADFERMSSSWAAIIGDKGAQNVADVIRKTLSGAKKL